MQCGIGMSVDHISKNDDYFGVFFVVNQDYLDFCCNLKFSYIYSIIVCKRCTCLVILLVLYIKATIKQFFTKFLCSFSCIFHIQYLSTCIFFITQLLVLLIIVVANFFFKLFNQLLWFYYYIISHVSFKFANCVIRQSYKHFSLIS